MDQSRQNFYAHLFFAVAFKLLWATAMCSVFFPRSLVLVVGGWVLETFQGHFLLVRAAAREHLQVLGMGRRAARRWCRTAAETPAAPALPGCWLPQRRKQIVSKQAGTHADSFPSSWLQAASFRNKQRCDHLCCLNSLNCLLPRNAWRWLAVGWHCLRCSYLSTSLWLQSGDGGGLAKNPGPCQGGRLLSRSTLVLIWCTPTHHHPVHSRLHCIASPTLEIEILAKCISLMLYTLARPLIPSLDYFCCLAYLYLLTWLA